MVERANSQVNNPEIDPDLEHLKKKSTEGALNIVGDILNDPKVQQVIKNALTREVITQTVVMSCLFIGILKLYDVAKQVLGFSWQVETVISLVLVAIGLSYMFKNVFTGKSHAK